MDIVSYLREDFRWSHEWQEQTMQDVTQEQLDWHPPVRPTLWARRMRIPWSRKTLLFTAC